MSRVRWVRSAQRVLGATLLTLVALGSIAAAIFLGSGGRFHNIQTPSMGVYAPVGTLVLSMPTTYDAVHVGQTVFFTPPGGHETYFHRVASKDASGIKTSGDLTGVTDPWTLGAADISGSEVARVLYLGWLLPILPILLVGGIVVHVFTRFFIERFWRFPLQVLGWSSVLSVANYLLQPLLRAVFLSQVVHDHAATIRMVATGILPLNVSAVNGDSKLARIGEIVVLHTAKVGGDGRFNTIVSVHMEWWTWLAAAAWLFGPLLLCGIYLVLARRFGWDLVREPAPVVQVLAAVAQRARGIQVLVAPAIDGTRVFDRWQANTGHTPSATAAPMRAFAQWGTTER